MAHLRQYLCGDCAQASFCAIAHNRVPNFAARRKTDPDTLAARILVRPRRGLENKRRPHGAAASSSNTKKIGAGLEPCKIGCHAFCPPCQLRRGTFAVQPKSSGGQALAALRAAYGEYPAASRRGHAGTKAMAALADELAGLVSALHGTRSNGDCLG
jgi:hypothetical protein